MKLVVIRGNSGSGKTSVAHEVRRRYGRGCALVEQDYLRRVVLREHGGDGTPAVAPAFITTVVRAALGHGYHVVLEGILHSGQYAEPLRELIASHPETSVYWMEVSFDETVRRHGRRPTPIPVTAGQMRAWYTPMDLLGVPGEQIIPESSSFEETVATVLHDSGLAGAAPRTPCPVRCPRCAEKGRPA
ncbi:AAA family ATPase [Actinoplanes sp. NPDC048988]|uniref:AAA family ATPase n=1 Tax=Actinoplanes sp. NPDC048988 TaxID=3363901 RepID=UPI00371207DB